jgi:hypothetical protein
MAKIAAEGLVAHILWSKDGGQNLVARPKRARREGRRMGVIPGTEAECVCYRSASCGKLFSPTNFPKAQRALSTARCGILSNRA